MSAPAFPTPTSPFFTHQIWPSSVRQHSGDAQNQRMKKDAWIEMISQIHEGWIETMGFDIDHPVNVVEGDHTLVIQLTSHGKMRFGKDNHQEYLLIYRFNTDNKVVSLDEWIDSAYAMKVWGDEVVPKFDADGRVTNVEEAKKAWAK